MRQRPLPCPSGRGWGFSMFGGGEMQGRPPNTMDVERMSRAIALVTAYDLGVEEEDFTPYLTLIREEEHPEALVQSLAQLSWLFLEAIEKTGFDKGRVLDWYGGKFAQKREELREES